MHALNCDMVIGECVCVAVFVFVLVWLQHSVSGICMLFEFAFARESCNPNSFQCMPSAQPINFIANIRKTLHSTCCCGDSVHSEWNSANTLSGDGRLEDAQLE